MRERQQFWAKLTDFTRLFYPKTNLGGKLGGMFWGVRQQKSNPIPNSRVGSTFKRPFMAFNVLHVAEKPSIAKEIASILSYGTATRVMQPQNV